MGKLHELLAVEPDLKNAANSIFNETVKTFTSKHDHFNGTARTYDVVLEGSEPLPPESKEMVTTVKEKLDYLKSSQAVAMDAIYQKELANTKACADIVFNGQVVAESVPATVLLSLEKHLTSLQTLYRAVPTLEPGKSWVKDTHRANTYRTEPRQTLRTTKTKDWRVIVPPTDKHPAHVVEEMKDVVLGRWNVTDYSGMMTPVEKSEMLARLDGLLQAVKKARCRANNQEVEHAEIGEKLFSIIHGG